VVALSIVALSSFGVVEPAAAVANFPTGSGSRLGDMRREVAAAVGLFVLAALVTTAAELAGIGRRCGCRQDCWCRRPGLRLFRWVAPVAHRSLDPAEKTARA
jgi:hypothetical protein